jgi:beta-galactosidase/beta-glucuronidase
MYLYFDGVYKNSEVWINGQYLGKRPSGYASFYYDLTPHLNRQGDNVVAVKVNHTDFGDSRWYSGSGINRNVYLLALAPVHIGVWGIVFTTPEVSATRALARVAVHVENQTKKPAAVRVTAELVDATGKTIRRGEGFGKAIATGGEITMDLAVDKPGLWSPESPVLYTLRTTLYVDGKQTETVTETVGFRSFRFDAATGFFLNDRNLKLKGLCIHDDAGALGSAVPADVWERRLRLFKAMGCNAIRMSHNPHQDYLYDLCDKLGLIVQDEAFDEWEVSKNKWIKGWNVGAPGKDGYSKNFAEWSDRDVRDMILRNRNRTCILMWSIGNEIDYPNDPYTDEILNTGRNPQIYGKGYQASNPPARRLGEIATHLAGVVKHYDSTRPVTAALAGVVMSNLTTYPEALDLVGYNYQEYRYTDDHAQYPQRIIYGSENSKSYDAWEAVVKNDFIAGQFLWTGIDFLGEARAWPVRGSGAGLVDLAGFPKPEYYYRKSLWTDEPVIYLAAAKISDNGAQRQSGWAAAHWNWTVGDSLTLLGYTNADEAELFINNRSLGRKPLLESEQKIIRWKVAYQPGTATLVAYTKGGETGRHTLKTAGDASQLKVSLDRTTLSAAHREVAHIVVEVTDAAGNLVPSSEHEISCRIEGPARLMGLENGDLASHEDYKGNKRKAFRGKWLAYIQVEKPGPVKVILSAPGLDETVTVFVLK